MTIVAELWSAAVAAAADDHSMQTLGMPSPVLMERASLCVASEVEALRGDRPVVALVGPGNNGGDGLAVARILRGRGVQTHAYLVTTHRNEAAEQQLALARAHGVRVHETPDALPLDAAWVDGLLGTGASGAPRGAIAQALSWLRSRTGPRIAIDVPSGVNVDTGEVPGEAVAADITVSFVRSKPGLHITPGRDHAGRVVVAAIGIQAPPGSGCIAQLASAERVASMLSRRVTEAEHKGHRGHVAVLGGSPNTPGAAVLAGVAAMRTGAGLCTLVGATGAAAALAIRPELMGAPWEDPVLPTATVLVVGPGLTAPPDRPALANLYRDDTRPCVWDASALEHVPLGTQPAGPRVITPHPGEAARLLARAEPGGVWTSARVQEARLAAAHALQRATGATVVLKGAGTLILDAQHTSIATEGSDVLATAGTGDVLAGCIGALLGQGLDVHEAASAGVSVHGRAGDEAARRHGQPLALEVAEALPTALRALAVAEAGPREPTLRRG